MRLRATGGYAGSWRLAAAEDAEDHDCKRARAAGRDDEEDEVEDQEVSHLVTILSLIPVRT